MWSRVFKSQDYGRPTYKYKEFPVFITDEFNFFRCVEFQDSFYHRTASELFNGNLRECSGRYASLFPQVKLSYWANSVETARAEIKKHGAGNSFLIFWAYDDGTSTFPTLPDQEPLVIIDGRRSGIQDLLDKADDQIPLNAKERSYLKKMLSLNPDCLAYESHAFEGGENFIFFEKGFKKLALRELTFRLSEKRGVTRQTIVCADSCDYSPSVESYGEMFVPKSRIKMDENYLQTEEYLIRKKNYDEAVQRIYEWHKSH